jgi:hypothetical protein
VFSFRSGHPEIAKFAVPDLGGSILGYLKIH